MNLYAHRRYCPAHALEVVFVFQATLATLKTFNHTYHHNHSTTINVLLQKSIFEQIILDENHDIIFCVYLDKNAIFVCGCKHSV